MIVLNSRIANVPKPHFTDNEPFMGHRLNDMLAEFRTLGRLITKITIEYEGTKVYYFILPGRWIDRLYDNGMMRRGTL